MQAQQYAARFAEAQVTSVDRKQLLLLMFEGGLKFLRLSREGLAAGDMVGFGHSLSRAQAIISELLSTLDRKNGGKIAEDLARLYDFMLFNLTDANTRKSVAHVDQVLQVFSTVADAYRAILEGSRSGSAAA